MDATPLTTLAGPEQDHYRRMLHFEQSQARRLGKPRMVRYFENRKYYYGENADPDNVEQPLHIRYVRPIVEKHVHYLFGEWEQDIVNWTVTAQEAGAEEIAVAVQRAIYRLMRRAEANDVIRRGALDGSIYGDTVFRLRYDERRKGATFETVLPEYYHAIWHPLDITHTLEACVAYNLDRQLAYQLYGTIGNARYYEPLSYLDGGFATVWEWWSEQEYLLAVDDVVVLQGPNPYRALEGGPGRIPLIHIANCGVNGEYYGFGDAEPIHALQDELNMRLADMGDIVNYHAHPITLVRKFFGDTGALRTSPDGVWDMGREGEAEYLEWGGTPPAVFDYLELVLRILFDTANLTPVAFGRAEQSQATGSALVVQMLPIVEIVRRKRSQWSPRLRELARGLIEIEAMSMTAPAFQAQYGFALADLERVEITPKWHPILPRDRLQVVNENVALLVNKARSIERTLEDLGEDDPKREYERIIDDLKAFGQLAVEMAIKEAEATARLGVPVRATPLVNREGGKNSDRASGGSNTDS